MLIHLVPRFLTFPVSGPHIQLIDLRIDSIGLLLRDRVDLATRRPMPNKRMAIGCSKRGRLARVGLLIDTLRPAQPCTVVYRWTVAACAFLDQMVSLARDSRSAVRRSQKPFTSSSCQLLGASAFRLPSLTIYQSAYDQPDA